jgi:hypothetical protein
MKHKRAVQISLIGAALVGTLSLTAHSQTIFSVGGNNTPASIQSTVDAFRAALGNPNNGNAAGPLASGRREINWDGGGSTATAVAGNPFNGFRNTRGESFSTPGTGFVQAPPDGLGTLLNNATYASIFTPFSNARVFASLDSNVMDVTFFVPGSNGARPATVSAFGSVFSDVDLLGSTQLDFFDVNDNLLTSQIVAPGTVSDGSLSFLGVNFTGGEDIARVRITSGNAALGPNDDPAGGIDLVVMDDFFSSEPQAVVPEPSAVAMLLSGIIGTSVLFRRRKR